MSKRQDEWERTSQSSPTATDQCQKRQDEWKRTSQSPPTATEQCQKDKTSGSAQAKVRQQRLTNVKKDKTGGSAQAKVHQQRLTSVKKTRRVEVHKPKSTNSDCPVRKRQDEWERTSQSLPTATDQCQKHKTSGSAQAKVRQQRLTNVKKDKTGGSAQAKVHQQRLTSVKKTRRVEVHKPKSTNSDCPVRKRQDEWERTSQSLPTATDQCQKHKTSGSAQAKVRQQRLTNVKKDKTGGSAQAKVHQQRLTSVKKTRRVEVHKPKSTNSDCPVRKRQDEWERTSQSLPTATDQCQKDMTSGRAQVKVHQQ